MDLADVGGNVKDGCHSASMGGTWMMMVYGLGGMRDDNGTLSFWPRRAPEDDAVLQFPIKYKGQLLYVEIGPERVRYSLQEGDRLVIRHEAEEVMLTAEAPSVVRLVSRKPSEQSTRR
jgi:alpha,alpha-trehalose phosphorylase